MLFPSDKTGQDLKAFGVDPKTRENAIAKSYSNKGIEEAWPLKEEVVHHES